MSDTDRPPSHRRPSRTSRHRRPRLAPRPGRDRRADPDEVRRLARRRFFRSIAADAMQTAATVVGAAGALRETHPRRWPTRAPRPRRSRRAALRAAAMRPTPHAGGSGARSASNADRLVLARPAPPPRRARRGRLRVSGPTSPTRSATWSSAARRRSARSPPSGSPSTAGAVRVVASRTPAGRSCGTANALAQRPPDGGLRSAGAMDRMLARYAARRRAGRGRRRDRRGAPRRGRGDRRRGDAIDHATTGRARRRAPARSRTSRRPLRLLTLCNTGPLAGGQVGTALGVVPGAGRRCGSRASTSSSTRRGRGCRAPGSPPGSSRQAGDPAHARSPTGRPAGCWPAGRSTPSSSAPTGSRRTATRRTRSARIRLAVLAARHGVPFLVVAPTSTLDADAPTARRIPIELRRRRGGDRLRGPPDRARRRERRSTRPSTSPRPSSSRRSSPRPACSAPRTARRSRRPRPPARRAGPRRRPRRRRRLPAPAAAARPRQRRPARARSAAGRGPGPPDVATSRDLARSRLRLAVRATEDRALLRAFLERDRLYAAYALCDLDDREFARTRWGVAHRRRRAGRGRPRVRRATRRSPSS